MTELGKIKIPGEERRALAARAMRNPLVRIMPQICAWLDANDIPHGDVPVEEIPTITDGKITVRVFKRTITGNLQAGADGKPASEVVTVPLLVEPPDVLKPWLEGQVPVR